MWGLMVEHHIHYPDYVDVKMNVKTTPILMCDIRFMLSAVFYFSRLILNSLIIRAQSKRTNRA